MKNARLLLIAVVLVVVAVLIKQSTGPVRVADPMVGNTLLSGAIIDRVRGFTLKTSGGNVEVKHERGRWRLVEKAGIGATNDRIEEMFQRLASARIGEMVSKNPDRHADMGVAKVAEGARPAGDSMILVLNDAGGKEIKTLYLGKGRQARGPDGPQQFGEDGQYMRFSDSDSVYLISQRMWLEKDLLRWINTNLASISENEIKSLSWKYTDADEGFVLQRSIATAPVELAGLAEDRQTAAAAANAATGFFAAFAFDDVIATDTPALHPSLASGATVVLQTFDGLQLSLAVGSDPINLGTLGQVNLMHLTAEYSGSDPSMKELADELAANSKKVVYALRDFRLKPLLVRAEELSEPRPEPESDTATGTATLDAQVKEEVSASHILVAWKGADRSSAERTQEEAKTLVDSLLERINKGEELGKLAEEFSDCPSGKSAAGSLGSFGKGMMAKPFEETAFSLEPGQVSQIVETSFGYHIIRRDS